MANRHVTSLPAFGRVAVSIAATVAAAGIVNCATYRVARDGTLAGSVSSNAITKRPAHATLDEIRSGAPGTYIERVLADRDSTVERWADHVDQPLRVWIDSSTTISGSQAKFPAAVREAFTQWLAVGLPLHIEYVSAERDADVRVRWTDHLDRKTGSTTWRTDRNHCFSRGDIVLATHVSDGQPLDARGMRAIALHEVGHALGLAHSASSQDIMAPLVHVDALSPADRSTIKLLYSLQPGPVR